ncbi:hypothetical protein J2848_003356 [Azospirillum lipoferum]|uniref:PLC-like phosphodiesterase n=1 Tax=Azospirillum lipoferum TaxID=193 RepID=A0A5A9GLS8_AZOLI|nr:MULTISPECIES: hypothetical protein [Azospirillum]KAA0595418.1 hypothetical protein FZ942_17525 [Azospirillum lipoferum]MCP1611678.1 hypothetical protein [Azospirillum lipoferum]MDW5533563.1 hypothetical protein [Azospirillum sp. NL1]
MPSKGVNYYFYVSNPGTSIAATEYDNVKKSVSWTLDVPAGPGFRTGTVEVDYSFSFSGVDGSFGWQTVGTTPVLSGLAIIDPVTGNMDGGNLSVMMNTPSFSAPGFALSYGFYDSGPGYGDLTNRDQAYAYLTPPMNGWMGRLVAENPAAAAQPFNRFCLPGAHDAGTFDLGCVRRLLSNAQAVGAFLSLVGAKAFGALADVAASQAVTAITNLAVTQKDNVVAMLNMGCRYFDFRPGYLPPQIRSFDGGIYHQHTVIPGYPFASFLSDLLQWLAANPSEIVVVSANSQGFYDSSMAPDEATLAGILAAAQSGTGSTIAVGSAPDLESSYADLLSANKRLIFLNQISGWLPASKYDSYSDGAYATTQPGSIVGALSGMTAAGQSGSTYTVLQLQGTATNTGKEVIVSSAASQSSASSPLMSTKAYFDSVTYPWLLANVGKSLGNDQLVVFLNDFVDNALAATAATITLQRMGLTAQQ